VWPVIGGSNVGTFVPHTLARLPLYHWFGKVAFEETKARLERLQPGLEPMEYVRFSLSSWG